MEWLMLVLGAIVGVAVEKIYGTVGSRVEDGRRAANYKALNEKNSVIQSIHADLQLVQAGWDPNGFFSPASIQLCVDGDFRTPPQIRAIAESHRDEWVAMGATDGAQIGLNSFRVDRVSDDPADERLGTAHRLEMQGHIYQYFDFLASHRTLIEGSEAERAAIGELEVIASPSAPAPSLPTPLSVGLSLIAEQGAFLILTRRATNQSHAGTWAGGRIYNAVGEGAAPRDLAGAGYKAHTTSAEVTAARGLYEEIGLQTQDMVRTTIRLHSFAFDSSLRDYKFFGVAETHLSTAEIRQRWMEAPDRSESSELFSISIETRNQCLSLIANMVRSKDEWSVEAVFCTLRTLLCLERVSVREVIDCVNKETAS